MMRLIKSYRFAPLTVCFIRLVIVIAVVTLTLHASAPERYNRLLNYIDHLPPYVALYTFHVPLTPENCNALCASKPSEQTDVSPAFIGLYLYSISEEGELMETMTISYDAETTALLHRTLSLFDGEQTKTYNPITNWLVMVPYRQPVLHDVDTAVAAVFNPFAHASSPGEEDDFRKYFIIEGNKLIFQRSERAIFRYEYTMPDSEGMLPPIAKRTFLLLQDRVYNELTIESSAYHCSDGTKVVFPRKSVITEYVNFDPPRVCSINVLNFDRLSANTVDSLFNFHVPDNAAVSDKMLGIIYVNKAKYHGSLEEPYPTKFEFFGVTLNDAKRFINETIREDRMRYEASQAAPD